MVLSRRCPPALHDRSPEARGKPRIGGLAILGGLLVALVVDPDSWRAVVPIAAATLLGLHDDATDSSARLRLAALLGIATGAAILSGSSIPLPVLIAWILCVTVGFDFIDGLDGLAGGLALVALVPVLVFAPTVWVAALVGGVFVFVMGFNLSPARALLGDAGSNGLGVAVALAAVSTESAVPNLTGPALLPLALLAAVPLLDLVTTMIRRATLPTGMFTSERGHLHHRLAAAHGRGSLALLELVGVGAICSFAAVLYASGTMGRRPLIGAGIALSLLLWRTRGTPPPALSTR